MPIPIGLQLYSIKEETNKDFVGSLEKVAEIGYQGVEFAGYGGISAMQMSKNLERLGLVVAGSHVGIDKLKNELDAEIEYNIEIGNRNIVCPYAKPQNRQEYIELAKFLNETGEKIRKKGLLFYYHNHGHEFIDMGGIRGLNLLCKETEPELLKIELDLYWVKFSGLDPFEYLKSLGGRVDLLHYKDMNDKLPPQSTDVGLGIIDFKPITEYAKSTDVKWIIVEQEHFDKPHLESVKNGFDYIKRII